MHDFIDPQTGEPAKAVEGRGLDTIGRNLRLLGQLATAMYVDVGTAANIASNRPATFQECMPSGGEAKARGVSCCTAQLAADVAAAIKTLLPHAALLAKVNNYDVADQFAKQRGCSRAEALPDAVLARATGKA